MKYHWDESILLPLFADTAFWKGMARPCICARGYQNVVGFLTCVNVVQDIEWIRVYRTYTVLPLCCVSE